jgi:hypothetical protein
MYPVEHVAQFVDEEQESQLDMQSLRLNHLIKITLAIIIRIRVFFCRAC